MKRFVATYFCESESRFLHLVIEAFDRVAALKEARREAWFIGRLDSVRLFGVSFVPKGEFIVLS